MADTPPKLSNEMTDAQRAKLTFQHKEKYERLLADKKAADNKLTAFGKEIKADLGKEGLANIKDMIALSEPEGEARLKEDMERRRKVFEWLAIPMGTQGALFPDVDPRPITERAWAEGKRAGLAGEPFKNPYHPTNDGHKPYEKGWREGQDVKIEKGIVRLVDTKAAADSLAPA